jgi:hypothetical protein
MANLDLTLDLQRKYRTYVFAHELWVERTEGLLDRFDTTLAEYINLQEARTQVEESRERLSNAVASKVGA